MSEWNTIDTAPRDGTAILLTDGQRLAAGALEWRIEPDWKYRGYNARGEMDEHFTDRVPNPDAGKRIEWWGIFGCSGFSRDVNVADYDGPLNFEPTHWMPLPKPPIVTVDVHRIDATTSAIASNY